MMEMIVTEISNESSSNSFRIELQHPEEGCSKLLRSLIKYLRGTQCHISETSMKQTAGRTVLAAHSLCLVYFSALKMEATYSSEPSVDFQRTARHYTSENRIGNIHRSENFKSYIN
jgi:hypothetical protein